MNAKFIDYQKELLRELKDREEARAYLNAAIEDEDPRVFALALKHVIQAQNGSISAFATQAKLDRAKLYHLLSRQGGPRLNDVQSILSAMGWHLTIIEKQ